MWLRVNDHRDRSSSFCHTWWCESRVHNTWDVWPLIDRLLSSRNRCHNPGAYRLHQVSVHGTHISARCLDICGAMLAHQHWHHRSHFAQLFIHYWHRRSRFDHRPIRIHAKPRLLIHDDYHTQYCTSTHYPWLLGVGIHSTCNWRFKSYWILPVERASRDCPLHRPHENDNIGIHYLNRFHCRYAALLD